jgi:hypothetical protein
VRAKRALFLSAFVAFAVLASGSTGMPAFANPLRTTGAGAAWQTAPEIITPGRPATFVLNPGGSRVCFVGLIGPRRGLSVGWRFAPQKHRLRLTILTHPNPAPGAWSLRARCIAAGSAATARIGYTIGGNGSGPLAAHGDMRVKRAGRVAAAAGPGGTSSAGGSDGGSSGGSGGGSVGSGSGGSGGSESGGGSSGGSGAGGAGSPVLTISRAGSAGGGESIISLSAQTLAANTEYAVSCWATSDSTGNGGAAVASFTLRTDGIGSWAGTAGCTLPESLYGNLRIGPNVVWSNTVPPTLTGDATPGLSVVSSNSDGANLRASPWGEALRYLPNGTPLLMVCWQDSVWANGNYWTNRWFYVTAYVPENIYNQPSGWIHASLVANQTVVPQCDGFPPPNGE